MSYRLCQKVYSDDIGFFYRPPYVTNLMSRMVLSFQPTIWILQKWMVPERKMFPTFELKAAYLNEPLRYLKCLVPALCKLLLLMTGLPTLSPICVTVYMLLV